MNIKHPIVCAGVSLVVGCSGGKSDSPAAATDTQDTQEPQDDTQDSGEAGPDWDAILASIGTTVAMPRFGDMVTTAESLSSASQAFCAAPDAAGLEATQTAWHAVMEVWKQGEPAQFGPVWNEPWRVGPKLDFWPARPSNIESVLAADYAVDAEAVSMMGTVTRGLPVLDWILFEPGADTLAAFTDTTTGARRCDYLVGLTGDVHNLMQIQHDVWSPDGEDWLANYTSPGPSTDLMSTRDTMDEVVNRTIFAVENVRTLKLGKPAGQDSGGTPQPDLLESPQSGRGIQNALDVLQGVEDTVLGDYGGVDGLGLLDAIPDDDKRASISADFARTHAAAVEAVAAIPAPLSETIFTDPVVIDTATSAVRDLQVVLQVDLAQALSVTIRFNDTDGD